jgi:hypothetical protein
VFKVVTMALLFLDNYVAKPRHTPRATSDTAAAAAVAEEGGLRSQYGSIPQSTDGRGGRAVLDA